MWREGVTAVFADRTEPALKCRPHLCHYSSLLLPPLHSLMERGQGAEAKMELKK
jgi:hypothetical protein